MTRVCVTTKIVFFATLLHLIFLHQNFSLFEANFYTRISDRFSFCCSYLLTNSLSLFFMLYLYLPFSSPKPIHPECGHRLSRTKSFMANEYLAGTDRQVPSRWYTVLALPFPDQKLGRRDINTFGRGFYASRAGFFSNPSL